MYAATVNRRVASSNLARGANFSFSFNYYQVRRILMQVWHKMWHSPRIMPSTRLQVTLKMLSSWPSSHQVPIPEG